MKSHPDYRVYVAASGEVVGTFALLIMDTCPHGCSSGVVRAV